MKKFISAVLASAFTFTCTLAGAVSGDVQILNDSKTLSFSEEYTSKTNLTVTIAPKAQSDVNSSSLPKFMYLYTTDDEGNFLKDISLSSKWESGVYTAYIDATNDSRSFDFIYVNPESSATLEVIDLINGCADSEEIYDLLTKDDNGAKLGIDTSADYFVSSALDVLDYVIEKKDGDYTYETFMDHFNDGSDVASLLFEIKNCEAYGDLKDIIEDNADFLGIEFDKNYDKVKQKSKIYVEMFKNLDDITDYASVAKVFEDAVKDVLDNQKESTSSGGNSSGKGNGGGTVVFPTTDPEPSIVTPLPPVVDTKPVFTDMGSHFSKEAVEALCEKNVISGYPDNTFAPDSNVTRAEFSKIASLAFGFEPDNVSVYEDVQTSDWFCGYVGTLSKAGVINGYDGKFNPSGEITRQDAACIIYRILADKLSNGEFEGFNDADDIAQYAKEAVNVLAGAKIINGYNGSFNPKANITRGEAAVMIFNALNSFGK